MLYPIAGKKIIAHFFSLFIYNVVYVLLAARLYTTPNGIHEYGMEIHMYEREWNTTFFFSSSSVCVSFRHQARSECMRASANVCAWVCVRSSLLLPLLLLLLPLPLLLLLLFLFQLLDCILLLLFCLRSVFLSDAVAYSSFIVATLFFLFNLFYLFIFVSIVLGHNTTSIAHNSRLKYARWTHLKRSSH